MPDLISPQLLDAISWVESNNNPSAVNPNSGARGQYQFLPIAWKDVQQSYPDYSVYDYDTFVTNPRISREFAQRLLELNAKRLKKKANLDNLLASYNFGIGNVMNGVEFPPETIDYIKKIKKQLYPKKQVPSK